LVGVPITPVAGAQG